MPAAQLIARRHVLLVLEDEASHLVGSLRRACRTADLVACRSAEEVLARLASGRRYSAVLTSAGPRALEPDLIEAAARASTPVIVVGHVIGDVIGSALRPVPVIDRPPDPWPAAPVVRPVAGARPAARLVAVCGPGGTGASTVAAALASGLAESAGGHIGAGGPIGAGADLLLADLALSADLALLHGLNEPGVSLLDLVRSFRRRRDQMTVARVRAHTVRLGAGAGGFRLLAGLGRPSHWSAVSPAAFDQALCALRSSFGLVLAEVTADFEGDRLVGSADIEERNHMARRVAAQADLVVVVGRPGPTGRRRLAAAAHDLLDLGVEPARIQPVVNRLPEDGPVVAGRLLPDLPAAVITLPEQRLDHRAPVPAALAEPVRVAVVRHLAGAATARNRCGPTAPVLVTPGSLGSWGDDAA